MKNKYMFGGFIILLFLGIMAYLFTQSNIKYEDNFANVKSTDKIVKATGSWVKEKSYDMNREQNTFSFIMKDEAGNEMKVIYEGAMPNNFESATSVVVTGSYQNGYFHAKDILTKCPSKYEEQNVKSSSM
ncbi:MAG: cytochrome c maturation protein CcmE [Ignavibacteriaceae bacterium]|nr:cytochrome c maturation protein CcmE [Ignavibacterium sp.]MCC6253701.1 cytochrome c maturation protein CcmE [Ignavibacteriaceae bacterium]HMN24937.1 cytochrome c maturation protein CcmE [Ignavibacteriaceae bacterium]HRN25416.1 cytochrome c maturation protein CcmE [Ignavibacteriaceae bacterium]HRP91570.1 cytochrome c maturation protein CcmE [Ignavibacteriaceae bacterium]